MLANGGHNRVWTWLALPALLAGCQAGTWGRGPKQDAPPRPPGTIEDLASFSSAHLSPALKGTIGEVTYLQGQRLMAVRGYGLVCGLDGRGSRNCPPSVREHLIREIRRLRSATESQGGHTITAEQLLDSLDTAVVEVHGEISAGAAKGRTFDVFVRAMDDNTRSIVGGYLMPCELKIYGAVSPAEIVEGRTHARARGPVFVNPFAQDGDSASPVNPREGRVIGGAVNVIDRRLNLVTIIESYTTVNQVTEAINRRFSHDPKTADGRSPTHIDLAVPEQYRGREKRFLDLVRHLPLSSSPMEREARAKMLVGELARSDAPWEDVALSLEGLGPFVIEMVQQLYTDPRSRVNYYAARTGLRLADELAIEVIIRHAKNPRSPFRPRAIEELGCSDMPARAGAVLRELLADPDVRIRVRAYEALRKVDRDAIARCVVGREPGNFILEIVPSDGPPVVYARKTKIRRLALIGEDRLLLRPPLFYAEPGKPVMLTAKANDRMVTVLRKEGGQVIGEFRLPLRVAELTRFMGDDPRMDAPGRPRGLGLDYPVVLDVLYRLREKGAISADVRWEEPGIEDLVGPLGPMGRPESEL